MGDLRGEPFFGISCCYGRAKCAVHRAIGGVKLHLPTGVFCSKCRPECPLPPKRLLHGVGPVPSTGQPDLCGIEVHKRVGQLRKHGAGKEANETK